jgi:gluconate 2-dehydrogenase gamma chain
MVGGSFWMLRPRTLHAAAESSTRQALSEAEWKTVEAITGRLIPTDHEPGAIEANCVNFIDKALAHEDAALKPVYQAGLRGVDAVSHKRFDKAFVELTAEQQDEILAAIDSGKAEGWPKDAPVPAPKFFEAIRTHTVIGFLADPKYGGNRDYAGWKVIGYPGGGHHLGGFSPDQMMGKAKVKTAWGEEV